ncbi:hypothetical protein MRX96_024894 [Rhipicephalus microplus]
MEGLTTASSKRDASALTAWVAYRCCRGHSRCPVSTFVLVIILSSSSSSSHALPCRLGARSSVRPVDPVIPDDGTTRKKTTSRSKPRDDFSAAASSSHPVYSPSVGSPSSVYGASSPYGTSASGYSGSGSGGQASPNSNLYYYYYPVSKNSGQQTSSASDAEYQASAAQNYAGVSAPGSGSSGSSSSSGAYDQAASASSSSGYGASADGGPLFVGLRARLERGRLQRGRGRQLPAAAAGVRRAGWRTLRTHAPLGLLNEVQKRAMFFCPRAVFSNAGAAQYAHLSQLAQQYGPQLAAAQQYAQYAQPGTGHYAGGGSYPSPSFQGSYDTSKRYYGLGSVIMPLLALAGLGLLIPTVTSLSGKKKRSIEDASRAHLGDYAERLERYFKIYRAAVESEECMNRIVCELGDAVSNVRGKSALLTVMEKFAPGWMNNKIGVFKNAALTVDTTKCSRYKC